MLVLRVFAHKMGHENEKIAVELKIRTSRFLSIHHTILRSLVSAMARVKMIHAAASVRNQPHSPTDNENTPFNSIRLLRGAPPGRVGSQPYCLIVIMRELNFIRLF